VVVTKGTIIIRGARIDVRQDPEGYQYGVVTAAPGKLAYYKQKRDSGVDEWTEGESEVIEYDSRADNVKFIRRAIMRRLIGAKVNDETTGALIVYDQSNDTFTVNGAPLPPGASVPKAVGSRCVGCRSATAADRSSRTSRSTCRRARSSACSAPTALARRPRST
jgi:lipopolysaccharide export system protein LptA